jgi:hypothetical protein
MGSTPTVTVVVAEDVFPELPAEAEPLLPHPAATRLSDPATAQIASLLVHRLGLVIGTPSVLTFIK